MIADGFVFLLTTTKQTNLNRIRRRVGGATGDHPVQQLALHPTNPISSDPTFARADTSHSHGFHRSVAHTLQRRPAYSCASPTYLRSPGFIDVHV